MKKSIHRDKAPKDDMLLYEVVKNVKYNLLKEGIIKAFWEKTPLTPDIQKEIESLSLERLCVLWESVELAFPDLTDNPEYQSNVGFCLAKRGLYAEASLHVRKAIDLSPEDYRHKWLMAQVLSKMDDDRCGEYEIEAQELVNHDLSLLEISL